MKQRFLIIQTAFIGDVVLATGILEKLHNWFPDADIDVLVRNGNQGLLHHHPFVRKTFVWEKKKGKLLNLAKLLFKIRAGNYDKVINLQRFAATGLLTAFSRSKEKIGFDKNPFSFLFSKRIKHIIADGNTQRHEIDRNNDLIASFTDRVAFKPKLYPGPADFEAVQSYKTAAYCCIAPSSVWYTKQYPPEQWISLINKLPASVQVYLLGGSGDRALCESIASASNRRVHNLAGKLNFLQSAALMQHATMNYVNDSAPMHFASAMNAPVTAVYCSTVPSFGFGPLSDRSHVVETTLPLECRPCGLHGRPACPLGHFNCARTIVDAQLLAGFIA